MRIHHIGYAVKSVEKAKASFLKLGYTAAREPVFDPLRNVDICFLEKDGCLVELVAPSPKGKGQDPVSGILIKLQSTPYHICYETDRFDEELEELCSNGFMMFKAPEAAPALENRRVAFLLSPAIGQIELLEQKQ